MRDDLNPCPHCGRAGPRPLSREEIDRRVAAVIGNRFYRPPRVALWRRVVLSFLGRTP